MRSKACFPLPIYIPELGVPSSTVGTPSKFGVLKKDEKTLGR